MIIIIIICYHVDGDVPTDHRMKIRESEKRDKFFDLAGVIKKQ